MIKHTKEGWNTQVILLGLANNCVHKLVLVKDIFQPYNEHTNRMVDLKGYFTGGFQMAYVISDDCISCGSCEPECPVSAISAGDSKYVVDEDTCISCGSCAAVCPVGAPAEA